MTLSYNAALSQDYKTLDKLCEEIAQKTNISNVYSWLNPTQCYIANNRLFLNITENDEHIKCLQFIIDRLYVLINLLNEHIERKTLKSTKIKTCKNLSRPTKMTLGLSATVLCDKITEIDTYCKDRESCKIVEKSSNDSVDKSNQTDIPEDSKCPSCYIAIKCMKKATTELSKMGHGAAINDARKTMHEGLFNMSQAESMEMLSEAFVKDLSDLVQFSTNLKNNFEIKTSQLNDDLQNSLKKIDELDVNRRIIEENALKEKEKSNVQSKLLKKLFHEKSQLENDRKSTEKIIQDFRQKITENELITVDLWKENENLNATLSNSIKTFDKMVSEKELWKVRFTKAHEENENFKSTNEKLKEEMHNMQNNIDAITDHYKELDTKITKSAEEIDENAKIYEKLFKKTEDVVNSTLVIEEKVNNSITHRFNKQELLENNEIVKGNPLIDMVKQVEMNKTTMKDLETQNETLLKTIKRFCQISSQKNLSMNKN